MKNIFLVTLGLTFGMFVTAQDITDALRYGLGEIQGTARFRAMGGAFGALGGDLSAVSQNPAGSVIFNSSAAAFTLAYSDKNNDISYGNGLSTSSDNNFDITQGGAVFVYQSNSDKWNKFALGINYERTSDFNDEWVANGTSSISIGDYFSGYANGLPLGDISAFDGETLSEAYADIGIASGFGHQQAFLGFESFILEPATEDDNNTIYTSNSSGDSFNQRYRYTANGSNGKMAFNFAAQYDERLSLGLNLNVHFIDYERITVFDESSNDANSLVTDVGFDNSLLTTGTGFSFQLGSIFKVTEELRIGATYESPTWYRISEETTQYLETNGSGDTFPRIINPGIINIYPEYKLQTPGRITGSLAYVFGDKGLLSFDYSRKDFGNTEFRPTNDEFFAIQNAEMASLLDVSNTYRFGGEYRYKQFSFRGGYRIEESPYADDRAFGDLTAYSLGLGYRYGNLTFDLAFTQAEREVSNQFYSSAPTFTQAATVDTQFTNVVFTIGFGI